YADDDESTPVSPMTQRWPPAVSPEKHYLDESMSVIVIYEAVPNDTGCANTSPLGSPAEQAEPQRRRLFHSRRVHALFATDLATHHRSSTGSAGTVENDVNASDASDTASSPTNQVSQGISAKNAALLSGSAAIAAA